MRKRIKQIWGVGLVVVLLTSLLVMAAPASADAILKFDTLTIPTTTDEIITDDNISDFAVGGDDGQTIFAVVGNTTVYKSTDGGMTWEKKLTTSGGAGALSPTHVAVAPDDDAYVTVASATTVYISTNGGATWGTLGIPQEGSSGACAAIKDLAISAAANGDHTIAVAGNDGTHGNLWFYELGIGGSWEEANDRAGFNTSATSGSGNVTNVLAVAFSPNFASDETLVAVTENGTATLEMFSLNTEKWNAAAFDAFTPVSIEFASGNVVDGATAASLSLAPTYLGGDDLERVAFVGITDSAAEGGVYRVKNTTDAALKTGPDIHSVSYDGTNLVAGNNADTTVWRCSDPLASSPTFIPTSNTKEPAGDSCTNTIVAWSGTNVVAAATGTNAAFAVSMDNGKSFNDVSLINTDIDAQEDIAISADGTAVYMVTADTGDTTISVWRRDGRTWFRVLSITDAGNYIIRIAPDDPDVVYVALLSGTSIYYSSEGGDSKWYSRTTGSYNITDLAVESEDVAYIAETTKVSKTTNGGFTWATSKSAEIGTLSMLKSLGEDLLITCDAAAGAAKVAYSTNGNSSWTAIGKPFKTGAGGGTTSVVTASGLGADDYIYVGNSADTEIQRRKISDSPGTDWKDMSAPIDSTNSYAITGIGLANGALYAVTSNGSDSKIIRTLEPTHPGISPVRWSNNMASTADFGNTPNSFVASSGSNLLWLVDSDSGNIYNYSDTLVSAAPELVGPVEGYSVPVNEVSGTPYNVTLSWKRVSEATSYEEEIAFDSAFNEVAVNPTETSSSPTVAEIVAGSNFMPGTTYYWRVRVAQSGPIYSPWSETRTFTVKPGGAAVPSVGSPENGGTFSAAPAFSWSPVSGTTLYEFQLATDTTFATPSISEQLASTGYMPSTDLADGVYFWRVRALEPVEGDWSTIANFTVSEAAAEGPSVVVPPAEAPVVNIPPIEIPPAQVEIQPAPSEPAISEGLLLAIIIIGAILVIALIVLIVRTRRAV